MYRRSAASTSASTSARQSQRGDGLDVQAPVGPQQLERVERQRTLLGGRRRVARQSTPPSAGTQRNVSSSSSTRSHSTQRSTSGRTPSASARPDLEPARHAPGRHAVVEQLAGAPQQARRPDARRLAPRPPARPARRDTRRWPSTRAGRAGAARRAPTRDLGDDVERPAAGEHEVAARRTARRCRRCGCAGRRTPLAMARTLPSSGVSRSARGRPRPARSAPGRSPGVL